ncbi:MAG TPA: hypothetical protein VM686_03775 [Polyangiaceae bacterium]|nr:hypothetical protein [Polyangiaceae bacterium]
MKIDEIAKRLCSKEQIGLSDALASKLGLGAEDAVRGRLMALSDIDRSFFGVYILGAYVIDDTDFWGDGEIYWWSIPTIVDGEGKVTRDPLNGLPSGAPPHKVGSLEWMTNLSLNEPPLVALIPPENRAAACTIRFAFYDDDGKPADMRGAMEAGVEAFAAVSPELLPGAEQIITPVRQAIFSALKAQEDDILIDQDVTIRRGSAVQFSNGLIGSTMNSMIRLYYFVRDETRTEQFGPVTLHKGQSETVKFSSAMKGGGRLAMFARGADVSCSAFGELSTDTPFVNRTVDRNHETQLQNGFTVTGNGAAKFIAYYTPPS